MRGWECPRCGRTYAPLVATCGACQPHSIPATSTTPWPYDPNGTARPLPKLPENTCHAR